MEECLEDVENRFFIHPLPDAEIYVKKLKEVREALYEELMKKINVKDGLDFYSLKNVKEVSNYFKLVLKGERINPEYGIQENEREMWEGNELTYNLLVGLNTENFIIFDSQDGKFQKGNLAYGKSYIRGFMKGTILHKFRLLLPSFFRFEYSRSLYYLINQKNDILDPSEQENRKNKIMRLFKETNKIYENFNKSSCIDTFKNYKIIGNEDYYFVNRIQFIPIIDDPMLIYTMYGFNILKNMEPNFALKFSEDYIVVSIVDTRYNEPADSKSGVFTIVSKIFQALEKIDD